MKKEKGVAHAFDPLAKTSSKIMNKEKWVAHVFDPLAKTPSKIMKKEKWVAHVFDPLAKTPSKIMNKEKGVTHAFDPLAKTSSKIMNKEKGIALLEGAVWAVILGAFVIAGLAIAEHIQRQRFLETTFDKYLSSSAVRPFRSDLNALVIDDSAITKYIEGVGEEVKDEIVEYTGRAGEFYIELLYADLQIDTVTGKVAGSANVRRRISQGDPSFISPEIYTKTDLSTLISHYLNETKTESGAFLYATPSLGKSATLEAIYQGGGVSLERTAFAPSAVLVAARAFFAKTKGSPAEFLKKQIGVEPIYYSYKVKTLRGDFNL
ncbi:MAG: hypothetical protein ACOX2O_06890 [Bdellovibrionota bacterium]